MPITYKATDLQRTTLKVWFDVRRGLKELAEVRGVDTTVPGLDGQIPRNRKKDRRDIELYGWIHGATESEFWTLVKEMQALFAPTAATGTLSVPLADGTTATIVARAVALLPEEPEHLGNTQHFAVLLLSVVPDWTFT